VAESCGTIINLLVPEMAGNFLTTQVSSSFSWKTLIHGVGWCGSGWVGLVCFGLRCKFFLYWMKPKWTRHVQTVKLIGSSRKMRTVRSRISEGLDAKTDWLPISYNVTRTRKWFYSYLRPSCSCALRCVIFATWHRGYLNIYVWRVLNGKCVWRLYACGCFT